MADCYAFPEKTKFLVTGGAGFVGSNLVEEILSQGYQVRVLDNFATGKEENIRQFIDHPNFELFRGDIRFSRVCQQACEGVDYVLHQAALGSAPRSIKDPRTSNDVNITGTLNMFIAARDKKVRKIVFASSSSVYGDEPNLPQIEDRVGIPLSPYAITKKVKELYARNFYQLYQLPVIGLRYFNVFGKKQDTQSVYAAVIPIFLKKLINDEAPQINGDGYHSRDFTYVRNVVQANLKACLAGEEVNGEVLNIAYGEQTTIRDLYDKIAGLLGKDIEPIYCSERPGDIKHTNADISKAKRLINYKPQFDINRGLQETLEWYKEFL